MTLRWLDIDADATVQNKGSLLFLLDQRRRRFLFFSHRVKEKGISVLQGMHIHA